MSEQNFCLIAFLNGWDLVDGWTLGLLKFDNTLLQQWKRNSSIYEKTLYSIYYIRCQAEMKKTYTPSFHHYEHQTICLFRRDTE